MNLGQSRSSSPRSVVLVDAFTAAGAESVTSFQTNGTVIFSASDPANLVERVRHGSNPTLTRMLGVPVTCRGIPTMIRLATRL